MEAVLRAIAEPHRRAIVGLLRHETLTARQIAAHFDVSRTNISQHLRILRESGLINERRQGSRRLYRNHPENIAALKVFLDGLLGTYQPVTIPNRV